MLHTATGLKTFLFRKAKQLQSAAAESFWWKYKCHVVRLIAISNKQAELSGPAPPDGLLAAVA